MAGRLPIRLRTIAAAVVVVASGLIIFYSYQSIINSNGEEPKALPIIHAATEPFRVLPDDPGGAAILHRGSTLFDVMEAEHDDPLALDGVKMAARAEPETIDEMAEYNASATGFELPEVPEKRTESLYGMIEDLKTRPKEDDVQAVTPMDVNEKQALSEKLSAVIENAEENARVEGVPAAMVEKTDESNTDEIISVETSPSPQAIPVPSSKPSVPVKAVAIKRDSVVQPAKEKTFSLDRILNSESKKQYYIQLASMKNESDARTAYARIRDQYPALVEGVGVVYPKADLGARGTFTRIQVGPLSETEVKKRCAAYASSSRGGTCLVVSR